jgi:hypothetical protein
MLQIIISIIATLLLAGSPALAQNRGHVPNISRIGPAPSVTLPAPNVLPNASVQSDVGVRAVPLPPPPAHAATADGGGPDACDCWVPNYVQIMRNGRPDWVQQGCRYAGKQVQSCTASSGC